MSAGASPLVMSANPHGVRDIFFMARLHKSDRIWLATCTPKCTTLLGKQSYSRTAGPPVTWLRALFRFTCMEYLTRSTNWTGLEPKESGEIPCVTEQHKRGAAYVYHLQWGVTLFMKPAFGLIVPNSRPQNSPKQCLFKVALKVVFADRRLQFKVHARHKPQHR